MDVLEVGVRVRKEGQAAMLGGPRIFDLPGRCWEVGYREVTHSREMPDGLRDTVLRPGCLLAGAQVVGELRTRVGVEPKDILN